MINKFLNRLKDFTSHGKQKDFNKYPLFHYGHYDKNIFNKTCNFLDIKCKLKFIDLNTILKQESFVIKGALNYGLKSIIKAMNINGLTDLDYSNESDLNIKITRGEDCMYQAWKYYTKDKNENIMKMINQYNDIDCKGLDELMMKIMMKRK
jgi:predicted RecB family nuclease